MKDKKKAKLKKKLEEKKALVEQYEWLKDIDAEFEIEEGQLEQQLENLKKLRNNYVEENKNLIRHINKRVETVADNLENE